MDACVRWRPIEASCDAPEEPWDEEEVRTCWLLELRVLEERRPTDWRAHRPSQFIVPHTNPPQNPNPNHHHHHSSPNPIQSPRTTPTTGGDAQVQRGLHGAAGRGLGGRPLRAQQRLVRGQGHRAGGRPGQGTQAVGTYVYVCGCLVYVGGVCGRFVSMVDVGRCVST